MIFKFYIMPQMINLGSELLRFNLQKNTIEYSRNGGRSWVTRYSSGQCGTFRDLLVFGNEIIACTSKGLYYSGNQGRSWVIRCTNGSSYGEFLNLQEDGRILYANTSKGLYYSRNGGRGWVRR